MSFMRCRRRTIHAEAILVRHVGDLLEIYRRLLDENELLARADPKRPPVPCAIAWNP